MKSIGYYMFAIMLLSSLPVFAVSSGPPKGIPVPDCVKNPNPNLSFEEECAEFALPPKTELRSTDNSKSTTVDEVYDTGANIVAGGALGVSALIIKNVDRLNNHLRKTLFKNSRICVNRMRRTVALRKDVYVNGGYATCVEANLIAMFAANSVQKLTSFFQGFLGDANESDLHAVYMANSAGLATADKVFNALNFLGVGLVKLAHAGYKIAVGLCKKAGEFLSPSEVGEEHSQPPIYGEIRHADTYGFLESSGRGLLRASASLLTFGTCVGVFIGSGFLKFIGLTLSKLKTQYDVRAAKREIDYEMREEKMQLVWAAQTEADRILKEKEDQEKAARAEEKAARRAEKAAKKAQEASEREQKCRDLEAQGQRSWRCRHRSMDIQPSTPSAQTQRPTAAAPTKVPALASDDEIISLARQRAQKKLDAELARIRAERAQQQIGAKK